MSRKNRLVGAFAIAAMLGGGVYTGTGAYQSLSGNLNDRDGRQAVEKCVQQGGECTIEEFRKAAEFSHAQDKAGEKIIIGNSLFLSGAALLLVGGIGGAVRSRRETPKKPPQPKH